MLARPPPFAMIMATRCTAALRLLCPTPRPFVWHDMTISCLLDPLGTCAAAVVADPGDLAQLLAINDIPIEDTFAEAFPMTAARLIVTAETPEWARTAGMVATGYAASVIGCDAEAAIERSLSESDTPDGRHGISLLFFAFNRDALQKLLVNRS